MRYINSNVVGDMYLYKVIFWNKSVFYHAFNKSKSFERKKYTGISITLFFSQRV